MSSGRSIPMRIALPLPLALALLAAACQGDGTLADDDTEPEQVGDDDSGAGDDDASDDDASDDDASGDDDTAPTHDGLSINEFMASNASTVTDETGAYADWIEIHNGGAQAVDLEGMHLTDDLLDPTKWEFGAGLVVPAGGYLLLWADGDVDQGSLHAPFRLSAGGEEIGLYGTVEDGTPVIDSLVYDAQQTDVSMARMPDGSTHWEADASPTPGAENG